LHQQLVYCWSSSCLFLIDDMVIDCTVIEELLLVTQERGS
jgi:hypothetical protein